MFLKSCSSMLPYSSLGFVKFELSDDPETKVSVNGVQSEFQIEMNEDESVMRVDSFGMAAITVCPDDVSERWGDSKGFCDTLTSV